MSTPVARLYERRGRPLPQPSLTAHAQHTGPGYTPPIAARAEPNGAPRVPMRGASQSLSRIAASHPAPPRERNRGAGFVSRFVPRGRPETLSEDAPRNPPVSASPSKAQKPGVDA